MKKILFWGLILLSAFACTKSDFDRTSYNYDTISGSGSAENTDRFENYISSIATQFVADNLLAAEGAILFDKVGNFNAADDAPFHPDGQSVWTEGAVWTIDREQSIKGVSMKKTAQDSTWIMSRDADYNLPSGNYPTKYSLLVTCHKSRLSEGGGTHFNWDVSFVEFERTEFSGFSAKCSTAEPISYLVGYHETTWESCRGGLTMEVFRDGVHVDKMYILYTGIEDNHQFIRNI